MTAVPALGGVGVEVICDQCGAAAVTNGCGIHDAEVVYGAVAALGWSGSAFATGPHACPACAECMAGARPPARPERAGDAPGTWVSIRLLPSAAVVRVTRDIDADVVPDLRTALEQALRERARVVVDLEQVHLIDSTGLGTLVRARNAARQRHGTLALAAPSRFVQTVLRTMRLHTAFPVYSSADQAVAGPGVPETA
ncbi:STAS domain-containing protein [Paractinoplanes rhizophilus]|jgi:anti-anti-sigma factor|uniref:Anti-sigma factor antagonist n=1 Tax=Paractinoplanes rhizophilus TaxID=1416877 RepID=A0ABW2HSX4_9ACTN|nr:STAS domain-containing protein [Actinoplanes sp.]